MEKLALYVPLEAKAGLEQEVEDFLISAKPLADAEPGTLSWYAFKTAPGKFGVFDTFADEAGRDAHLSGEIAKALMANADRLLATPPQIYKVEILASK